MSEQKINLGKDDLREILESVVAAARQPIVSEAEQARIAGEQEERKRNAETVQQQREDKLRSQKLHSHMRSDGTTCCVPAHDDGGDFLICQRCHAIIRNAHKPATYDGTDLFDPDLYMKLFQLAQPEIFA